MFCDFYYPLLAEGDMNTTLLEARSFFNVSDPQIKVSKPLVNSVTEPSTHTVARSASQEPKTKLVNHAFRSSIHRQNIYRPFFSVPGKDIIIIDRTVPFKVSKDIGERVLGPRTAAGDYYCVLSHLGKRPQAVPEFLSNKRRLLFDIRSSDTAHTYFRPKAPLGRNWRSAIRSGFDTTRISRYSPRPVLTKRYCLPREDDRKRACLDDFKLCTDIVPTSPDVESESFHTDSANEPPATHEGPVLTQATSASAQENLALAREPATPAQETAAPNEETAAPTEESLSDSDNQQNFGSGTDRVSDLQQPLQSSPTLGGPKDAQHPPSGHITGDAISSSTQLATLPNDFSSTSKNGHSSDKSTVPSTSWETSTASTSSAVATVSGSVNNFHGTFVNEQASAPTKPCPAGSVGVTTSNEPYRTDDDGQDMDYVFEDDEMVDDEAASDTNEIPHLGDGMNHNANYDDNDNMLSYQDDNTMEYEASMPSDTDLPSTCVNDHAASADHSTAPTTPVILPQGFQHKQEQRSSPAAFRTSEHVTHGPSSTHLPVSRDHRHDAQLDESHDQVRKSSSKLQRAHSKLNKRRSVKNSRLDGAAVKENSSKTSTTRPQGRRTLSAPYSRLSVGISKRPRSWNKLGSGYYTGSVPDHFAAALAREQAYFKARDEAARSVNADASASQESSPAANLTPTESIAASLETPEVPSPDQTLGQFPVLAPGTGSHIDASTTDEPFDDEHFSTTDSTEIDDATDDGVLSDLLQAHAQAEADERQFLDELDVRERLQAQTQAEDDAEFEALVKEDAARAEMDDFGDLFSSTAVGQEEQQVEINESSLDQHVRDVDALTFHEGRAEAEKTCLSDLLDQYETSDGLHLTRETKDKAHGLWKLIFFPQYLSHHEHQAYHDAIWDRLRGMKGRKFESVAGLKGFWMWHGMALLLANRLIDQYPEHEWKEPKSDDDDTTELERVALAIATEECDAWAFEEVVKLALQGDKSLLDLFSTLTTREETS